MLNSRDACFQLSRSIRSTDRTEPFSQLVHGAPGLGRSWLLDQLHARAELDGIPVLTASGLHCAAGGGSLLDQLLHGLGERDRGVGRQLQAAVRERVEQAPLLILVDDLHAADLPSVQELLEISRQVRHRNLMLVTTALQTGHNLPGTWSLRRLELCPLDDATAATLATRWLGGPVAEIDRLVTHSGGNPALLNALVQDLIDERTLPGDRPVAHNFATTLLDFLRRLPGGFSVASAIALLGESPRELVGAVAGGGHLLVSLHLLVATGLIDLEMRFRHPDAAEVVLDGLPPAERAALHDRAAGSLYEAGGDAAQIVDHLLSGSGDGPAWALELLLDAADQARERNDPDRQVALLRRASQFDTGLPRPRRFEVLARLARAEWRSDPSAADRRVNDLMTALTPADGDAVLVGGVIRQLFWHGDFQRACTALADFADDPNPDANLRTELRFIQQWLRFALPGEAERLRPLSSDALASQTEATAGSGSSRARIADLLAVLIDDGEATATSLLEAEALAAEPVDEDFELRSAVVAALVEVGELAAARQWCERVLQELPGPSTTGWRTPFLAHLADIEIAEGSFRTGGRIAEQALNAMSSRAWGIGIGQPLAATVLAATAQGRHDQAGRLLGRLVPEAMMASRYGVRYLRARGRHHLATGSPQLALADFRLCGRLLTEWGRDRPAALPWRLDEAEALVRLGNPEQARRLAAEHLALVGGRPGAARSSALRVVSELGLGPVGQLSGPARPAVAVSAPSGRQPDLAWPAPQPASDAVPASSEPAAVARLSAAERRVALLAAGGNSNRQIAEQLFITVSTVEQHLTRIFRKLGVRRREGLAGLLTGPGRQPPPGGSARDRGQRLPEPDRPGRELRGSAPSRRYSAGHHSASAGQHLLPVVDARF